MQGAVRNKNIIISSGHNPRMSPNGASGPISYNSSLGRNKVSIENGSLSPSVSSENNINSQNLLSLNSSIESFIQVTLPIFSFYIFLAPLKNINRSMKERKLRMNPKAKVIR